MNACMHEASPAHAAPRRAAVATVRGRSTHQRASPRQSAIELDLPSVVWKALVGEVATLEDLFAIDEPFSKEVRAPKDVRGAQRRARRPKTCAAPKDVRGAGPGVAWPGSPARALPGSRD